MALDYVTNGQHVYPDQFVEGAFDYALEAGTFVSGPWYPRGWRFSIKLEDQVLVTETGYENLTLSV